MHDYVWVIVQTVHCWPRINGHSMSPESKHGQRRAESACPLKHSCLLYCILQAPVCNHTGHIEVSLGLHRRWLQQNNISPFVVIIDTVVCWPVFLQWLCTASLHNTCLLHTLISPKLSSDLRNLKIAQGTYLFVQSYDAMNVQQLYRGKSRYGKVL